MILQLDDNYRIVSDGHNFILQRKADPKKNPRKGKKARVATDQWKNLGFLKDLSQLLASYTRQVLRTEIGGISTSRLYLVISELSGKLSTGLGNSMWGYGGDIKRQAYLALLTGWPEACSRFKIHPQQQVRGSSRKNLPFPHGTGYPLVKPVTHFLIAYNRRALH